MYRAVQIALSNPNSSTAEINGAVTHMIENACDRWTAYLAALAREHKKAFDIINEHLGEVQDSIEKANRAQARDSMIFNIILTVAVVGFLGPAAGAAAGFRASTKAMASLGTKSATYASEMAKDIAKDAVKNSLKVGAASLISESNKMVGGLLTVQGDPVAFLTNAHSTATSFRVRATERIQRLILLSAALTDAQKRANAVFLATLFLDVDWIRFAPETPENDDATAPRNVQLRRYFIIGLWVEWATRRDSAYWRRVSQAISSPQGPGDLVDIGHASHFEAVGRSLIAAGAPIRRMKTAVNTSVPGLGGKELFDVYKLKLWSEIEAAQFMLDMVPAANGDVNALISNWRYAATTGV